MQGEISTEAGALPPLAGDGGCAESVRSPVLTHTWKFSNADWDWKPSLQIRSSFLAQFYCMSKYEVPDSC